MPRQDIITALTNAVQKGEQLKQAKQTLINSGYSAQEVQEAAGYVTGGIQGQTQMYQQPGTEQNQAAQPTPSPQQPAQQPQPPKSPQEQAQQKGENNRVGLIILLVAVLIVIIASVIAFIVFKDQILDFFSRLSGA